MYQYLEKEKPVSDNNCTVNWIAHYVEDCFEETFSKSKINQDRKEFNYSIYKDEEYNYALYSKKELDAMNILAEERKLLEDETKVNKKIISEVVKKYKEYKELVKARKENYDGMDKEERGKFNELSEQLKEIAIVRIENPDMSLEELGKLLKKPIGKSGVNHRLRKIQKIVEELKEESNKWEK